MNNIEEICRKYDIENYTINDDGTIDVDGDVILAELDLKELPLNFNRVEGEFDCSYNFLTSLKGCPKYVGYKFACSYNELTTLEYSPEIVEDSFVCANNDLTTLVGGPKEVGGFFCYNNKNLTSLKGNPIKVLRNHNCDNCGIRDLYGISDNIGQYFFCEKNPISSIIGDIVDMDFVRAFNSYRVIKDGKVQLKRLKYVMETFNMEYDLDKIKEHYEIN